MKTYKFTLYHSNGTKITSTTMSEFHLLSWAKSIEIVEDATFAGTVSNVSSAIDMIHTFTRWRLHSVNQCKCKCV